MPDKKGLYPSLLSADFSRLGEQCAALEALGVRQLHLDVMDGTYVPQITFGEPFLKSLRKATDLFFDAHLMVMHPETHIEGMKESGVDMMTVHVEACTHLDRTLQAIRDAGMLSGVALNPATALSSVDYVLDKVDQILLMTVNPGFGGQSYIEGMTEKIRALREKLDAAGYGDLPIQVDGGITADNVDVVLAAGADRIVAGSGVFIGDMASNVQKLTEMILRI